MTTISPEYARKLKAQLMNAPVAPGVLAPVINVGTDQMLDVLEHQYFRQELADGISCFKYLEGDYGTGKTQFIMCLAQRAHQHHVVTSVVTIGQQCPFSSPLAILRNVAASFLPPPSVDDSTGQHKGVEILIQHWIRGQLRQMGVSVGDAVPDAVRHQVERPFVVPWLGAPDIQMGAALQMLGKRLLAIESGADASVSDRDLIAWTRGESVRSSALRGYGLHEPASDTSAFQRLKTIVAFLRERLNYKGFFVAFDEGTRVTSFRRGTVKQRQAIENMLTMINQNAEGEFGGVMFLYAATPELRTDVIQNTYTALRDRIGSVAFLPGRPMTPLIKLDDVNTDSTTLQLGEKLLDVFDAADGGQLDRNKQRANMRVLLDAQKRQLGFPISVPPRFFVFHWCRLLAEQELKQQTLTPEDAFAFLERNALPEGEA
jgi:hypothetical protein